MPIYRFLPKSGEAPHFLAEVQPIFPGLSTKQNGPLDKAWIVAQGIENVSQQFHLVLLQPGYRSI